MNTGDPLADRMTRFNTTSGTWHTVGSGNPGNGAFQASAGSGCNICAGIAIFHSKLHVGGNFSNEARGPASRIRSPASPSARRRAASRRRW